MIPIIYDENYTGYWTPQLKLYLRDTIKCEVVEERNGAYTLTLKYPIGGINWEEIKPEHIIEARVNDEGDVQPFRIRTVIKDAAGAIMVEAQHLSYDLTSYPGWILNLSNKTAKQVMDMVFIGTGFTASSDITGVKDFKTSTPTTARALLFGMEGSVLDTFGGELAYDRQTVYLYRSRGEDNGVLIDYAKNITALTEEESTETVYAGVFPYAIYTDNNGDDQTIALNPVYYQDCDIERQSVLVKDFSDQFEPDEVPTTTKLEQIVNAWMASNPINKINPKVEVSFIPLWYGSYGLGGRLAIHEKVHLCDTVTVKYTQLGVEQKAKVVRTKYDVLDEKFSEIAIGLWRTSFTETYAAMSDQAEATLTAISRYPSRWKADVAKAIDPLAPKSSPRFTGTVHVGNASSNGEVEIRQASASANDPYNLKFKSASSRYMAQHGTQYSRMYDSNVSGEAPAASGGVNNTTRNANGYYASDNTSFSAATKGSAMTREDGFITKDGDEVVTQNSNGLSWEHGVGAISSMRMYTLTHSSSSTAETTYTIDLPYGIYLFLHSRYTSPTAASAGMQFVTIGQTVGSSAIIKTSADSGSQIGAASGTRSQVEISNTRQGATSDSQDKLATVTWTVQGLSFRRLVMVRLM